LGKIVKFVAVNRGSYCSCWGNLMCGVFAPPDRANTFKET